MKKMTRIEVHLQARRNRIVTDLKKVVSGLMDMEKTRTSATLLAVQRRLDTIGVNVEDLAYELQEFEDDREDEKREARARVEFVRRFRKTTGNVNSRLHAAKEFLVSLGKKGYGRNYWADKVQGGISVKSAHHLTKNEHEVLVQLADKVVKRTGHYWYQGSVRKGQMQSRYIFLNGQGK